MSSIPDDYIDFNVSDLWRDHYAAQGLTHPSGRGEKPTVIIEQQSGDDGLRSKVSAVAKRQTNIDERMDRLDAKVEAILRLLNHQGGIRTIAVDGEMMAATGSGGFNVKPRT